MYSESQLNSMNKGQVVDKALQLASQLEELRSGPITPDRVKAEFLSLKKQSIDIAERKKLSEQAHKEAIAQITADKEKAIKELELKYDSNIAIDAKEIEAAYTALEKKAVTATADLTFGLEKAEIESKVKLDAIGAKVEKAKLAYEELEADLKDKSEGKKAAYEKTLSDSKISFERKLEEIVYNQKIALRDSDTEFVEAVAKKLDLSVVETSKLEELKTFKAKDEVAVNDLINEAINNTKSSIYASESSKYNSLKNATDNTIALLENDNKHLKATLDSANVRIEALEARLKEVPSQISNAVAAAKADISVSQDANKK